MQYGCLTESQIDKFNAIQNYTVRRPSYVVWIEGFGLQNGIVDPTEYIMEIDTETALESSLGRGYLNIGRAMLVANNENGYFYSDAKSKIKRNARLKIWAGFDNLNIPIFTGVVHSVSPKGTKDVVILNCKDYMGLFQEIFIKGNQEPNNTAKSLIENFCNLVNTSAPNIASTDETISVYTEPSFDEQKILTALEEVCDSIFYIAYFDEDGRLNAFEREYSNLVDFQFKDNNIIDCEELIETEIINDVTVEYEENFFSKCEDQSSIDTYGRSSRSYRILLLNSNLVSEKTTGSSSEILNYDLEAFKFTSSENSALIDCLHIRMKKNDAHGYITIKIYTDDGGIPGDVLATSQLKASANLSNEFSWEIFYFSTPVEISPLSNYWIVIDISSLSDGEVYAQISEAEALSEYAYYDGTWDLENNKQVLHKIRGSIQAQRLAEDIVSFYGLPYERIIITAPAVPQLQILDEVFVDIEMREIYGHYVIEGRRHIISPDKYITMDTLRKVDQ